MPTRSPRRLSRQRWNGGVAKGGHDDLHARSAGRWGPEQIPMIRLPPGGTLQISRRPRTLAILDRRLQVLRGGGPRRTICGSNQSALTNRGARAIVRHSTSGRTTVWTGQRTHAEMEAENTALRAPAAELNEQVAVLMGKIGDLEEPPGRNSSTSSKSPGSGRSHSLRVRTGRHGGVLGRRQGKQPRGAGDNNAVQVGV